MNVDGLMILSVKEADSFCQKWGLPGLHMERDCLVFSGCRELLQFDFWMLEAMLRLSIDKEAGYPKPNGFTELVDNIRWNIDELKVKYDWLKPLDTPY